MADGYGEAEVEEKAARMHPRSCTDALCVPLFVGALGFMGYVLHYAHKHGDIRRVYHGLDFQSRLCGVHAGVEDKPLLYWCTKAGGAMDLQEMANAGITDAVEKQFGAGVDLSGLHAVMETSASLDLKHPICVRSCPTGRETFSACFQEETFADGPIDLTGTFSRNTTFHFGFVADHPTVPMAARYCLPTEGAMVRQLTDTLSFGAESAMFHLSQVAEAWRVLVAAGFLAFLLGYVYLFLMKTLAGPLIYGTFVLSTLFSIGAGAYVLIGTYSGPIEDNFAQHVGGRDLDMSKMYVPSTGHKTADTAIGIALILVGLVVPIIGCCCKNSIELVLGSLEAALECLQDMPLLFLQPVVSVCIRAAFYAFAFSGLAWVMSVGDVANYSLTSYMPTGVVRTFDFEDEELPYLVGYVFVALWILELVAALEQFGFCYATQAWFFSPYVNGRKSASQFSYLRGIAYGISYHLGTLVFGSLLLAIFQALYFLLSMLVKQLKRGQDDDTGNMVVGCIAGGCLCCLKCWESVIRYLNKNVYLVVIINSEGFCSAAGTVASVLISEMGALGILEGITKIFQVGGVITITGCGAWFTWMALRNLEFFNDPMSEHFIPQPEVVTAASGVICCGVAMVFMSVFDIVSDTILMSWAIDRKYRKEHGLGPNQDIPARLKRLLDKTLGDTPLVE